MPDLKAGGKSSPRDALEHRGLMRGLEACARARISKLLSDDAPQISLQRLSPALNMLFEGAVDHGLIASAASGLDLGTEPVNHIIIQANGDPDFAWGERDNGSSFTLAEIISFAHAFSRIVGALSRSLFSPI